MPKDDPVGLIEFQKWWNATKAVKSPKNAFVAGYILARKIFLEDASNS